MNFAPIKPAVIVFDEAGIPTAPQYGDIYHARAGALPQARAVFLEGNRLPHRWRGRAQFVIVETGFGLGNNFLATWQAWREDPDRCDRLLYFAVERHPVSQPDLATAHQIHRGTPVETLAQALNKAWPHLTPDMHTLSFEDGRVELFLSWAQAGDALRRCRLQGDAFFLDGFDPKRNPEMWDDTLLGTIGRLSSPGATAATWSAARRVRDGLRRAGFEVSSSAGFAGKREMTMAVYRPQGTRRAARWATPTRVGVGTPEEPIVILGAGLAGAACAWALSRASGHCLVLDEMAAPAGGASGNPAGLFHGVVHGHDGTHARLGRAAALMAERTYRPLVEAGQLPGSIQGLTRTETRLSAGQMEQLIERLGLPKGYVDLEEAAADAGAGLWVYPGGGWIEPRAWVNLALSMPGVTFRGGVSVTGLRPQGSGWALLDKSGMTVARSRAVVLSCAEQGLALVSSIDGTDDAQQWPVSLSRGQLTGVPLDTEGLPQPVRPLSGAGYVLTDPRGHVWCGATTHPDDPFPGPRQADHEENITRLQALLNCQPKVDMGRLAGRVGWRLNTLDRLPLVGPVAAPAAAHSARVPAVHPTEIPAWEGLYLATALGSRGITWAPLMGRLLTAWLTDGPFPLPGDLVDAVDPRRFVARGSRRRSKAECSNP